MLLPKAALITNIPSPYRVLLFDKIAQVKSIDFMVIYCAKIETDRKWKIPMLKHKNQFLKKSSLKIREKTIYLGYDVWSVLKKQDPDMVITAGFNPVMIISWLYTIIYRKRHIVFTDSWLKTIKQLSMLHKFIRKVVFKFTDSFICVSEKGKQYLKSYGAQENRIFISPLAIDNAFYAKYRNEKKEFDIIFSGRLIARKMPLFCDVVKIVKKQLPDIKVLLLGDGPMKNKIIDQFEEEKIKYNYPGFVQPFEIPRYYAISRILMFPTKFDPWGIVANEACATGLPVITCKNAGAAEELVIHNHNGYILPLEAEVWAEHIIHLLSNSRLYKSFSENSIEQVQKFSIESASKSFVRAMNDGLFEN